MERLTENILKYGSFNTDLPFRFGVNFIKSLSSNEDLKGMYIEVQYNITK